MNLLHRIAASNGNPKRSNEALRLVSDVQEHTPEDFLEEGSLLTRLSRTKNQQTIVYDEFTLDSTEFEDMFA